jgi:hypothetical protein
MGMTKTTTSENAKFSVELITEFVPKGSQFYLQLIDKSGTKQGATPMVRIGIRYNSILPLIKEVIEKYMENEK